MNNTTTYQLPVATELNLDGVDKSELVEFVNAIGFGVRPIQAARILFPERQKGYVASTKSLYAYAANKLTAIQCRLDGKIATALQYEAVCDRIYKELPDYAKGW